MAEFADDNESFNLDFDEKLEIEKLQATIRSMTNFSDDSEGFLSQSPKALMEGGLNLEVPEPDDFDPYAAIEKPVERKKGPKAKKFVVMVNAENVNFFDKIPMEERTQLFNKLLSDYQRNTLKEKETKHLIKFSKHMFVAIMTIIISLPIMFIVVNKSIEMTINNYRNVQNNFEKLYESKTQNKMNSSIHRTVY